VYLIAEHKGMEDRQAEAMQQAQQQTDSYIRSVAGSEGAADQIAKGKELLDSGAITQAEFDSLKSRALAAT
jgi:membrane protease subunit (stomatin/prohibitin family)